MTSDTTMFDMRATALEPAMQIAFEGHKAWGYKSTKDRLTFAWHENAGDGFSPFVTPIDATQAVQIVKNWCAEVADYGEEPDNDGSVRKSWRVFCETWGYVDGNFYAFAAVEPYWAEYGK